MKLFTFLMHFLLVFFCIMPMAGNVQPLSMRMHKQLQHQGHLVKQSYTAVQKIIKREALDELEKEALRVISTQVALATGVGAAPVIIVLFLRNQLSVKKQNTLTIPPALSLKDLEGLPEVTPDNAPPPPPLEGTLLEVKLDQKQVDNEQIPNTSSVKKQSDPMASVFVQIQGGSFTLKKTNDSKPQVPKPVEVLGIGAVLNQSNPAVQEILQKAELCATEDLPVTQEGCSQQEWDDESVPKQKLMVTTPTFEPPQVIRPKRPVNQKIANLMQRFQ